jgi:hypothetical protein
MEAPASSTNGIVRQMWEPYGPFISLIQAQDAFPWYSTLMQALK